MTTKTIKALLVPADVDTQPHAVNVTIEEGEYAFPAFRKVAGFGMIQYMPRVDRDDIQVMADEEGIWKYGTPNPHGHVIGRLGLYPGTYPIGPVLVVRETVDSEGDSHYDSLTDEEIEEYTVAPE